MRCLATQIAALTFFMVLATAFRSSLGSQSALHEKSIFTVSPGGKGAVPDAPILEPVVILEGSQLKEPLDHDKMRFRRITNPGTTRSTKSSKASGRRSTRERAEAAE
jgi:hypothetical protein